MCIVELHNTFDQLILHYLQFSPKEPIRNFFILEIMLISFISLFFVFNFWCLCLTIHLPSPPNFAEQRRIEFGIIEQRTIEEVAFHWSPSSNCISHL